MTERKEDWNWLSMGCVWSLSVVEPASVEFGWGRWRCLASGIGGCCVRSSILCMHVPRPDKTGAVASQDLGI